MLRTVLERIAIVVLAFLVFLAFFPFAGEDAPGQAFSGYGNRVPTASPWLAGGVGVVTLVVLELVRWRIHRNRAY